MEKWTFSGNSSWLIHKVFHNSVENEGSKAAFAATNLPDPRFVAKFFVDNSYAACWKRLIWSLSSRMRACRSSYSRQSAVPRKVAESRVSLCFRKSCRNSQQISSTSIATPKRSDGSKRRRYAAGLDLFVQSRLEPDVVT